MHYELHNDIHMGIPLDLVDHSIYDVTDDMSQMQLHPKDEELLKDDFSTSAGTSPYNSKLISSKRSLQHSKNVPWLRRTEYIVSGFNSSSNSSSSNKESSFARKSKMLMAGLSVPNKEKQIQIIEDSFIKNPITKHHTKPNVKPSKIVELLPDMENWGHSCSLILFDQHPLRKDRLSMTPASRTVIPVSDDNIDQRSMNHALMKGMIDSNNNSSNSNDQFVAYFLPTKETLEVLEKNTHTQNLCYYNLHKKYNWNFKNKSNSNFDHYFFLSKKKDGRICFNEIDTIVQLGRRAKDGEKDENSSSKSMLVVEFSNPTDSEIKAKNQRLEILQPCSAEFNHESSLGDDSNIDVEFKNNGEVFDSDQEEIAVSELEKGSSEDVFGSDDE
ncbi:MAG: RNA polymerase-associated factor [Paramarteilia canceri]